MSILKYIFREEHALGNNQEGKNNHLTLGLHTSVVRLFKQLLQFISEQAVTAPQLPRRRSRLYTTRSHTGHRSPAGLQPPSCEEMTASLGGKKHVLTQYHGLAEVKSVAMDTHFGLQGDEGQ